MTVPQLLAAQIGDYGQAASAVSATLDRLPSGASRRRWRGGGAAPRAATMGTTLVRAAIPGVHAPRRLHYRTGVAGPNLAAKGGMEMALGHQASKVRCPVARAPAGHRCHDVPAISRSLPYAHPHAGPGRDALVRRARPGGPGRRRPAGARADAVCAVLRQERDPLRPLPVADLPDRPLRDLLLRRDRTASRADGRLRRERLSAHQLGAEARPGQQGAAHPLPDQRRVLPAERHSRAPRRKASAPSPSRAATAS